MNFSYMQTRVDTLTTQLQYYETELDRVADAEPFLYRLFETAVRSRLEKAAYGLKDDIVRGTHSET